MYRKANRNSQKLSALSNMGAKFHTYPFALISVLMGPGRGGAAAAGGEAPEQPEPGKI